MSNLKRTLGILLASVLLLTGCVKKPVTPEATPIPSPAAAETPTATASPETASTPETGTHISEARKITEDTECDDKACVADYLSLYWHLPDCYMTKKEAKKYGWKSGRLAQKVEGKAIGGDVFLNLEGLLPKQYSYYECDIDTIHASGKSRGTKRIVYSVEGKLIYYTSDHYDTFQLLYGEK